MKVKKEHLFCGLFVVLLFCAYSNWTASSSPGQIIPDSIASELRGGACAKLKSEYCTGSGTGCSSGTKIISGDEFNGKVKGSTYCASSCGSFAKSYSDCAE